MYNHVYTYVYIFIYLVCSQTVTTARFECLAELGCRFNIQVAHHIRTNLTKWIDLYKSGMAWTATTNLRFMLLSI